jgi:hypothetical protein
MEALPPFWQLRECKDFPGRAYYFNTMTKQSSWVHPTEPPNAIRLSHLLVKHAECAVPTGRKGVPIVRSHDDAGVKLTNIRNAIEQDPSLFPTIALQESDTADESDGLLGWVTQADLPEPLGTAAWKLAPNELSEVIETQLGFHLLFRHQ